MARTGAAFLGNSVCCFQPRGYPLRQPGAIASVPRLVRGSRAFQSMEVDQMLQNLDNSSNRRGVNGGNIVAALILFAAFGVYLTVHSVLKAQSNTAALAGDLTMLGLASLALLFHELDERSRVRAAIRQSSRE